MNIRTNNHWYYFKYRNEVTEKILQSEFSWLKDDFYGFFKYQHHWYHVSEFALVNYNLNLKDWDGYFSNTYFSGVLIKVSKDGEQYQVGYYSS